MYAFGDAPRVKPPEVLSWREFRAGLHRRPEAVVMSVGHYRRLVEAAERREAVVEAPASVRAEGLEPSMEGRSMADLISVRIAQLNHTRLPGSCCLPHAGERRRGTRLPRG